MRRCERVALAAAGAVFLIASAPAAETASPPPRQRVVTMTRFVKVFNDLEYELIDSLRAGKKEAVDRLLSSDFEQRNAARPSEPVPREDWLKSPDLPVAADSQIWELAVHDRGDLAIASFRLKAKERDLFIVDVWRRKGADAYELLTRYAAPVSAAAPSTPQAKPDPKK
jgi:hypothetical protein